MSHRPIAVFGASGHTGRFVVRELRRRGRAVVLAGRDAGALRELATADQVTIAHHLRVPEVRAYITLAPLRDLRDPDTPPPVAADASGRSAQTFLVGELFDAADFLQSLSPVPLTLHL